MISEMALEAAFVTKYLAFCQNFWVTICRLAEGTEDEWCLESKNVTFPKQDNTKMLSGR